MTRDAWMQVLPPTNHHYAGPNNWHADQKPSTNWTREDNKLFENALACFDGPDMWQKVAEAIPGKTVREVMAHYSDLVADIRRIEAGLFNQLPGYDSSLFTFDWENSQAIQGIKFAYSSSSPGGKKSPFRTASDQERKKGVPWTQEEHRLFLVGLKRHGKGDWRSISRNYVITRTPTQVASHAQKYFIRQKSGNKEKRRPSIHDITTNNLPENRATSQSQQQSLDPNSLQNSIFSSMVDLKPKIDSNYFNSTCHGNLFVPH